MRFNLLLSATMAAVPAVSAWDLQLHNQIAFMAEELIQNKTKWMTAQILEPEYQGSIGRAAGWADTVRRTPYPFSYGWHFISSNDTLPDNCSLDYNRDCQKGGCVVQQIANQTQILEGCVSKLHKGTYEADIDCQNALKWVIHFVSDVAQPLHASANAFGGNKVVVNFNGTTSNLHETWDRLIIYAGANQVTDFPDDRLHPYFGTILKRIQNDAFVSSRREWEMCNWAVGNGTYCAERWAIESNSLSCKSVYASLPESSKDLLKSGYAAASLPVVELQLAKAAWRMAGWLDKIAERGFGNKEGAQDEMTVQRPSSKLHTSIESKGGSTRGGVQKVFQA